MQYARVGIGNPNDKRWARDAWGRAVLVPSSSLPAQYAQPWSLGGGPVTARSLYVGTDEMNEMQAAVQQFKTDVQTVAGWSENQNVQEAVKYLDRVAQQSCFVSGNAWDAANKTCLMGTPDPLHQTYPKGAFTPALVAFRESQAEPFVLRWENYLTDLVPSFDATEFERLKLDLADLVGVWQGLGQTTTAVVPKIKTPGVDDDLAAGAATALKVLPWVLGLGLLAVGVVYLGPVIAPAIGDFAGRAGKLVGGKK